MIANTGKISDDFQENGIDKSYDDIFGLICKNVDISIEDKRFVYFIDDNYVMDTTKGNRYENLTPAYDKILQYGIEQLCYKKESNNFMHSYNAVCDSLILLVDRIIDALKEKEENDRRINWLENMKMRPAEHFEEAIQRMLLVNQMFWQTDHRLVGLGAWDSFLEKYYEKDLAEGIITKQDVLLILEDLFKILHENYAYKSNLLMGDTGQIFVLGRSDVEGNYLYNDLTYLFIEAMMNVQQTEPKCVLRVNKKTPKDLLEISLRSISTGIGAPLLANDEVIVPCLIDFGIAPQDACEYVTSACWEPLIGGKSSSNNNRTVLNYMKALDNLLKRERLEQIDSFDKLVDKYLVYLRRNLKAVKRVLKPQRFQYDPLLSVFTHGCYEKQRDVSQGGAVYHDAGITSVAMGNLVNSLLNIKKYVFEEKRYSLYDIKKIIIENYKNNEDLLEELAHISSHYGKDDEDVIDLVNRITSCVSEEIQEFTSYMGERMKTGLSGAAYLDAAKGFGASFDGRRAGTPFTVHISNEENESFTEIVNFASQLNYQNGLFNGNVLDFMVSPDFILQNWDKFLEFLQACVGVGFFEMQMNVVSSKQLIAARKNPDSFPNLIVRVWGFSAYFKDLPEDYKEVLIQRALQNERRVS